MICLFKLLKIINKLILIFVNLKLQSILLTCKKHFIVALQSQRKIQQNVALFFIEIDSLSAKNLQEFPFKKQA